MKTSDAGRKAITKHEGNVLTAYKDSGGVWTIGVGHTSAAGPPKVTAGMKITAAESDAILSRDLALFEEAVNEAVKVPLSQNEFDALVSLAFNIGAGAFRRSTLVRKLNAGDRAGAADAFLSWNKVKGKTVKGLTNRREAERKLFLGKGGKAPAPKPVKPKPAKVPPVPGTDPVYDCVQSVRNVQARLLELGYTEVGRPDGSLGGMTKAAILLFREDNGLPLVPAIDDELILALVSAKPRKLAPGREDATAGDVREKVPEAKASWLSQIGAAILGIPAAIGAFFTGILGNIGSAVSYVQPIKDFVGEVPAWVWFVALVLIAGGIFLASRHGEAKAAEAFKTGARR